LITGKLFPLGSYDRQQNYNIVPKIFIGNEIELILGKRITNETLKDFIYGSSIKKYYSSLYSVENLFNEIYLKLSKNRILLKVELENRINVDEYLHDNNKTEQVINICNQLYGEATIRKSETIDHNTSNGPLLVVLHNMVILEWNVGNIKIEYLYLPKEIIEQLPEKYELWHILSFEWREV
jgi:hypothetical protein